MSFKMFRYLEKHYVGKYRVKAYYDLQTLDFPRDENGAIDESFDDQYIPCKKGEIRHTYKNKRGGAIFEWYCYGTIQGRNVYKEIKEKFPDIYLEVDEELDKDGLPDFYKDCVIYFDEEDFDKIAEVVTPSTYGANIRPYSPKNLPKIPYIIPEKDNKKYIDIKEDFQKRGFEPIQLAILTRRVNKIFTEKYGKKLGEIRTNRLKYKELVHSKGLWDEYIELFKKEVEEFNEEE